jgi:hypothetical protein
MRIALVLALTDSTNSITPGMLNKSLGIDVDEVVIQNVLTAANAENKPKVESAVLLIIPAVAAGTYNLLITLGKLPMPTCDIIIGDEIMHVKL